MKNKNESIGSSLGKAFKELCYLTTIVFCALRSCDVIAWKWYWVISPLFISEIIGAIALFIVGAIAVDIIKNNNK